MYLAHKYLLEVFFRKNEEEKKYKRIIGMVDLVLTPTSCPSCSILSILSNRPNRLNSRLRGPNMTSLSPN